MNGYRYRCVITGTCSPAATSGVAILTVNTPISITAAPVAATICATGTTSFSVTAAGTNPTYQWQESTNGGTTWTNIVNAGIYSNANTPTLTITSVTAGMNGYLYRVVINGTAPCGAVNSTPVALNVSPQPSVTLTASPYTKLLPGLTTTITASVNPPTGFTTAWTWNGANLPVTGNSYLVDVNGLGTYSVIATIGSCISLPASITIGDSASNRLFIYPSPNDGRFTVSYYSPGSSLVNKTTQKITVYSRDGKTVYQHEYPVTQPYQLHNINLRNRANGLYYVILTEANGNTIGTGEVLVR
jgi:hypothetical protein